MDLPKDVIYVGNPYKTDNKTSSHHIAKRLSEDFRVIYLEAGGLRSPRLNWTDLSRIVKKLTALFKPIEEVEKNIFVKSIFSMPFGRFNLVKKANSFIQERTVRNIYTEFSLTSPIIWCVSPALIQVLVNCPRSLLVYYCVDDFSAFPKVDVELISRLDKILTESADVIFTPSIPLKEAKHLLNDSTYLSPHGVDIDHFRTAMTPNSKPKPLKNIEGQLVGFWGLIEDWIDLSLICFCAEKLDTVKFIMIGRIATDLDALTLPKNIIFLGPVAYEDLPIYAFHFDVLIIPYKLNKQVYNANPLKLREYLATGKPIVSVTNPEIEKYSNVVSIGKTYDQFYELLVNELQGNHHSDTTTRTEAVKSESWQARYADVISKVKHKLSKIQELN